MIPVSPPENQRFDSNDAHNVAISPDGTSRLRCESTTLLRTQDQLDAQLIQER
jgi:hypothetical protein